MGYSSNGCNYFLPRLFSCRHAAVLRLKGMKADCWPRLPCLLADRSLFAVGYPIHPKTKDIWFFVDFVKHQKTEMGSAQCFMIFESLAAFSVSTNQLRNRPPQSPTSSSRFQSPPPTSRPSESSSQNTGKSVKLLREGPGRTLTNGALRHGVPRLCFVVLRCQRPSVIWPVLFCWLRGDVEPFAHIFAPNDNPR